MRRAQDPAKLFQEAEAAFAARDWAQATQRLTLLNRLAPNTAAVLHLFALVCKNSGDTIGAGEYFAAALNANPADAQLLNNYANFCGQIGDHSRAVALYDQALALQPNFGQAAFNRTLALVELCRFADARGAFAKLEPTYSGQSVFWSARGKIERDAGDLHRAAKYYDRALALDPAHAKANHGRALIAMECGDADAPDRFHQILSRSPDDAQAKLGLAQALHEIGDAAGPALLDTLIAEQPLWLDAILVRAEMRWEAGEADLYLTDINRALAERPDDPALLRARIDMMAGVDAFAEAADFACSAQAAIPDTPDFILLEMVNAGNMGDTARADAALQKLRDRNWHDAMVEARHCLRQGDAVQADAILDGLRAREPDNISAWALSDFAWRLLDDDRHMWLHGQDNLYALRPLGLSDSDVGQIADYLRHLHNRRVFPVGQSLRGGTQTRGALIWRQGPEATLLREAIYAAVLDHWAALPDYDPAHPLLKHKAKTPAFRGSWSVRLTDEGFHVSHIHPHGLLSSASYWVVPEPLAGGDAQAGWLEIGNPPKDLGLPLNPRAVLQPKAGHLALFPSTLMHGTRPFAKGERITMAFDVVAH